MKRALVICLLCTFMLAGCSGMETTENTTTTTETPAETIERMDYESAFNYVKAAEERIIETNKTITGTNKYGESAVEVLIYSDEYAGLYCAYWSALEEVGKEDSRYEKSKLRWEIDYTNDEWKQELIDAFNEGGIQGFKDKYADIYNEEVFPAVNEKWKSEQK